MEITQKQLIELRACNEGISWFVQQKESDSTKIFDKLLETNHFQWANWLIIRLLNRDNKTRYAIFAASEVLHIFEKKYPNNKRPREAIDAAQLYLEHPTDENRIKCRAAAYAAAYADAAAAAAADAAAHAAAYADAYAYAYAYADAAAHAAAARKELQTKIIKFGIKLLDSQEQLK